MNVFPIIPATVKVGWFIFAICAIMALVIVLMLYVGFSAHNSKVTVEADRIRLSGDLWGRTIPFAKLDLSGARIMDLTKDSPYRPKWRTCGTGMPGYSSGWFRLVNKEKALLYVTRRDNVVYIPTTEGYSLLLSVQEPQRFLDVLRQGGAS
ncbi:MAG: PH domain-containing protein [Candidatus Omnitrophica bacterium]|nr:PH domain-containing protein [Candidatus Omnitrophota bacterium]